MRVDIVKASLKAQGGDAYQTYIRISPETLFLSRKLKRERPKDEAAAVGVRTAVVRQADS